MVTGAAPHMVWQNIDTDTLKGLLEKVMAAIDDLKAADATLDTTVAAVVSYLGTLATQLTGGVSAEDAETITADINAKAAALNAAITPSTSAGTGGTAAAPTL